MAKRKSLAQLTQQVNEWNAMYPVGTPVKVLRDSGEWVYTKTRSEAQVLSGHTAVIWLDGITGCYLLDRVVALLVLEFTNYGEISFGDCLPQQVKDTFTHRSSDGLWEVTATLVFDLPGHPPFLYVEAGNA